MRNSNETITNRTRDLPSCRAVPQPTAPPRASPIIVLKFEIFGQMIHQKPVTVNCVNSRKVKGTGKLNAVLLKEVLS
jgi:hypothetical protein